MPHPICDPRGHSYLPREQRLPRTVVVDPARIADCDAYLFGADLYNHGYFWEAQDAWEACWRGLSTADPYERFFRGLIQASVSHLKVTTGQIDGATSLGNRAALLLRAGAAEVATTVATDRVMGVDAAELADELEAYLAMVLQDDPPRHDARHFPYLRIATGPRR